MRKIKEVLRLKYEAGLSSRAIAKAVGSESGSDLEFGNSV